MSDQEYVNQNISAYIACANGEKCVRAQSKPNPVGPVDSGVLRQSILELILELLERCVHVRTSAGENCVYEHCQADGYITCMLILGLSIMLKSMNVQ